MYRFRGATAATEKQSILCVSEISSLPYFTLRPGSPGEKIDGDHGEDEGGHSQGGQNQAEHLHLHAGDCVYLTILRVIAVLRDGKMVKVFATVPMMMKVEVLLLR